MAILNNKKLFIFLVIVLLVLSAAVVYAGTRSEEASNNDKAYGNEKETEVHEKGGGYNAKTAVDRKDERQLVGFSSDVFFGRVVEQTGSEGIPTTKPGAEIPQTQYAVEVREIIKGNASGTVTVTQLGGYSDDESDDNGGRPNLIDGDPLLEPGQEYLFSTNYDPEEGWYAIVLNGAGDVPVESKAQRQELKEKFENARANQAKEKIPAKDREEPSAAEISKRSYRPCPPDESNTSGQGLPCNPSDPLPPGKSEKSSGEQPTSSGQPKSSNREEE